MKEELKLVRLGDLCDTISGLWTGKKPPFEEAIVIRNTNFTKDCKLNLSNVAFLDVESKQLQTRRLLPGDLIVEKSGGGPKQAVGRVVLFSESNGTYSLSNFTSALRLKNPGIASPSYLHYFLYLQYLSGVTQTMQSNSTGIRNLNMHQFLDIQIPLPSLEKQLEIVNRLDVAFAELDLLEKNFYLSQGKVKELQLALSNTSVFSGKSMLESFEFTSIEGFESSTKIVKLSDICSFSRGLTYSKSDEVDFSANVVLRANNIDLSSNALILEDLRYIKDSVKIKDEKIVKKNSLIICTASGSKSHVGKVALIDENYGYAFGGFMGQLTPSDKCNPKYLYYLLTSGSFKEFLMSLNDGTNINNLKFSDIAEYEILLPSLEAQGKIVLMLDSIFAHIEALRNQTIRKQNYAAVLRHSLLHNAFSEREDVAKWK